MLGERIKRARLAAGLNQRELASAAGVSAMAISKYERDESTPSSPVLLALGKALDVRTEYFFRQSAMELKEIEFRKHPELPEKIKHRVLADAQEQLERWAELDHVVPGSWKDSFEIPAKLPKHINDYDSVETVAAVVREAWHLGFDPIPNLVDTIEAHGITVLLSEYAEAKDFDGLAGSMDGHCVILVGAKLAGDRQRFTLAHELGHLLMKGRLSDKLNEETACNRFAGALLVPKQAVIQALGNSRQWLEPQELWLLKMKYGLSMGAWTYRARDFGIINQSNMAALWHLMRSNGWDKREPDPQYASETPQRFDRLVYRALAEDIIGESKAAELLGLSVSALHAKRQMERAGDPPHK
jgi:Zn-dependent peptidase ImmA (M78 family)/DNA-binding XRE family transcriptional regulator